MSEMNFGLREILSLDIRLFQGNFLVFWRDSRYLLRAEIFTAFGYIRNFSIKLILANLELLETAKITYLEIGLVVNFFQKNIEEKRRRFTFLIRQIIYSCFRTIYNNNSSYLFFEMMIETSQTELNLKISRS